MPTFPARIDFRRVRDFGEILNVSFLFIRQHFKPMMLGMLFIAGPFVLVGSVIPVMMLTRFSSPASESDSWLVGLGASTLVNMAASIVGSVMAAGVIYEYILIYFHRKGGDQAIQTADIWQAIRRDFWRIFGSMTGLAIMLGVTIIGMFLVSGLLGASLGVGAIVILFFGAMAASVYLLVPVTLVVIISLYERISFFDALHRAFYLVKGYWWQTFGLIFICIIIQFSVVLCCTIPFSIIGVSTQLFTQMGSSMEQTVTYAIAFTIVLTLVIALSYCLFLTVSAFQYFSLVERKESVGLREKIESMGREVPAGSRDFYADEEEHY